MNPYLIKALAALGILGVAFGVGWTVRGWKDSGTIRKLEGQVAHWKSEAGIEKEAALSCESDLAAVKEDLEVKREALRAAQDAYREAVARPPEVVVEYRDRIHTVRETIQSTDCAEAVGELVAYIGTLPDLPSPTGR